MEVFRTLIFYRKVNNGPKPYDTIVKVYNTHNDKFFEEVGGELREITKEEYEKLDSDTAEILSKEKK
ncbi:hypothetical protein [Spongiimicrobium salis]|uniref:hypothetical protein n=1 Tax=Spongiimicrobium salis TaxID=1667022 RepID=UPI00374C98FF